MLFFLLINVKMPTTVGILTFMSGKISCSAELSMIFLIASGSDLTLCYRTIIGRCKIAADA